MQPITGLNQMNNIPIARDPGRDMIPGINVGQAFQQALPWNWGKDLDVFDNKSFSGGERNPAEGQWFGNTVYSTAPTVGPTQPGGGNEETTFINDFNTYGGYGTPAAQQQALAQFGQSAGIIQSALDRLPGQLDIARGNINRQYETGINELNSNRAASENNFNTSTIQNQQGFRTNKNVINDQASQGLRGLMRILGSYGAVGSDMGLAGQAVANVASAQNAGAGQNYSQNQQALDTNWGNYKNQWENEKRKRDDWKSQQMNEVEARSNSTRQDLLSRLAAIRGDEAAARGGSYAGAAQPYIDQANQLSARIDELGRINPTYTGNTPVYNAPSLGSYSAGNGAITALQERVQGGMNTPYLNALLGRDRERKIGL